MGRGPSVPMKGNSTMNTTIDMPGKTAQATSDKVLYTAKVHAVSGRDGGSARSSDGRIDVKFSSPGKPGTGTNPEQMFAAGWSACFLSAMGLVASKKKVQLPAETAIDAEVDLLMKDGGFFIQGRLNVSLPGMDRQTAQDILRAAEQTCPYSKATKGNINAAVNLV